MILFCFYFFFIIIIKYRDNTKYSLTVYSILYIFYGLFLKRAPQITQSVGEEDDDDDNFIFAVCL